jgi:heparosan-N-sulfate-glucuronate 5-epimerase
MMCQMLITFLNFVASQYQITDAVEIDCVINQEYSIGCRREGDEIYMPFSFVKKYFEVYGSLNSNDGITHFDWNHSYGKVNLPRTIYDSKGIFMYFENYNVEVRDRVKCISANAGVPITTQWNSEGYFYATQIAQFGLSHYSKNLTEPEPTRKVLEDGESNQAAWIIPKNSSITRNFSVNHTNVVNFTTTNQFESAIQLEMDHVLDLLLSVDMFLRPNSSLMVTVQNRESQQNYYLHYILADFSLTVQDSNIYHGIGTNGANRWKHLARDLFIDVQKGVVALYANRKLKMRRSELKVVKIAFLGSGAFDNLTLSTSEHIQHFYDAAEWFVHHQNTSTGGWAIPVKRKLAPGFEDLPRGWYSAMSQGHAISLLARAFYHSGGNRKYLKAAVNALKPFKVASAQGGVLTKFMGLLPWYEEYPTTPPSFVLNGFIYSLLGLYDLHQVAPKAKGGREAGLLFDQGMESLKKMLTMFDTGSGSVYDLRHFSLGVAPNIARWDYHVTHVNQLLLLATIDDDPIFSQVKPKLVTIFRLNVLMNC